MPISIKKNFIFVSIASYRDDVCSLTLKNLFENAKHPENVFVGVCQQNHKDDPDCVENTLGGELAKFQSNVRTIRIPEYEAKGPTWARYLCSTLWAGEEYYMQIDSHTRFVKNWDEKCIKMIEQIKTLGLSNKPVLSHYPKDYAEYEQNNESNSFSVPRMCKSFFNERGMLSFMGAELIDTNNKPYGTPYLASGMLFCEGYFLNELPYDPNLPYLFVGEEILHSIRFYTFGWDIFTPTENVVFHEYVRAEKPKIWTDNPYYSDEEAFKKVKQYLNLIDDANTGIRDDVKVNMDKYGLGNVRSLQDYFNYAGIDIQNKTVNSNFCRDGNKASEEDIKQSNKIVNSNPNNTSESFQSESFGTSTSWLSIGLAMGVGIGVLIYRNRKSFKTK
jgi:hypothetical protein